MSSNYKVAVDIVLANGVSPVLAVISRDVLGVNSTVKQIENSFGRWAVAVGGVAAILGGTAILGALGKMVGHGKELVHQQELMKAAGMTNKEIAEATAKAYEVSAKVQTSTISENLKSIRELRMAFGDTPDALKYLETVRKAQTVVDATLGGHGDQIFEMVKALEMKGKTMNPQEFTVMVDKMTKAIVASGGRITATDFLGAFKYGRTAMLGWDDDFIAKYLPTLMQEMKQGKGAGNGTGGPGNALMSAFANVVAGQVPKTAAEEMLRLGMLDESKVNWSKSGHIANLQSGAVEGTDLFMRNPYEWVQKVLMPRLQAAGFTTQEQIVGEIGRLFKNRTAGQMITMMALQGGAFAGEHSRMEKDAKLIGQAKGLGAFGELTAHDPKTIMEGFHDQWKAMLEALGSPLVGPALEGVKMVTNAFTAVAQFAGAHPDAIRIVAEGLAILGGSLVVGGLVALGAAIAPLIGVAGGIAAAATALGALVVLNWDSIKNGAATLWKGVTEYILSMRLVADKITGVFGVIRDALESFVKAVIRLPASLLGNIGSLWRSPPTAGVPTTPSGVPKVIPQSFQGPAGEGGTLLHRANWSPPQKTAQPVNVASQINLDGRLLAEAVADKLAEMLEHPTSAPFFDPRRAWSSPDAQVSTT
jgi:hypothetical protein